MNNSTDGNQKIDGRRTRVEKGIWRRPDGKLDIAFRDASGKQRWVPVKRGNGGIKVAREELAKAIAARVNGDPAPTKLTFDSAADAWVEAHVVLLRPNSQKLYAHHLRHLRTYFGPRRRLTAISVQDVAVYAAKRRAAGAAPRTTEGSLGVLSGIYSYATARLGYQGANPVTALTKAEKPKAGPSTRRALTDDEVNRLLDAIPDSDRLYFQVLAETGLRRSEAAGLIWSNLNAADGTIKIEYQLDRLTEARALYGSALEAQHRDGARQTQALQAVKRA